MPIWQNTAVMKVNLNTSQDDFVLNDAGIWSGDINIRLAQTAEEIDIAQALRYQIFYEEQGATPVKDMAIKRRDYDEFDAVADHLIVLDTSKHGLEQQLMGNYRIIRKEAMGLDRYYTEDEFDISNLKQAGANIMELGRSCVAEKYRTKPILQLLWQGLAEYIQYYDIDYCIGCASFPGIDPDKHALGLSYLYHHHLAPESIRPVALPDVYTQMNLIPKEEINVKQAFGSLPPLIKGYLRVGSSIGDGAFIDTQFNTIDVCIVFNTSMMTDRYKKHYERKNNGSFE